MFLALIPPVLAQEPGGQECLDQCDAGLDKLKQTTCDGTCSGPPPEEDCECRSFKQADCTETCVWGYCANTCCTNYEVNCQYRWVHPADTSPPSQPTACDCHLLTADHPDLGWVKKGESLSFIAEATVSGSGSPTVQMGFAIDYDDQPLANSGSISANYSRPADEEGVDIYQALWSWAVPADAETGLYHLKLTIDCERAAASFLESHQISAISSPSGRQESRLALLVQRFLHLLGLKSQEAARTKAVPTLGPDVPFQPPFPVVVRPTGKKTLQLGTFLPARGCWDIYFQVVE